MFVVTEERAFRASHHVKMADGQWEPDHEHEWLLKVYVRAKTLDSDGFVMDFLELQEAINDAIEAYVGKSFNNVPPFDYRDDAPAQKGKLIPTAECIAWRLYQTMAPRIDDERICLYRVALREAPTSWGIFEVDHPAA